MEMGGQDVSESSELKGVKEPALATQDSEVSRQVGGNAAGLEGRRAQLRSRHTPEVAAAAGEQRGEMLHAESHRRAERLGGRGEIRDDPVQGGPGGRWDATSP